MPPPAPAAAPESGSTAPKPAAEGLFKGFPLGFFAVLGSIPYLARNKALRVWVALPVLVNLLVYVFASVVFFYMFGTLRDAMWAEPVVTAWYHWGLVFLWYGFNLLIAAFFFVAMYVVFTLTAGIVAAPFMEVLSQRVEELELGVPFDSEADIALILKDTAHLIGQETVKLLILVLTQLAMLLLWFVPVVGGLLYTICSALCLWWFLALNSWDYPFSRRRMSLAMKIGAVNAHLPRAMGFGAGINALLLVPVLNLLALPAGVVAGTRLALGLPDLPMSDVQLPPLNPVKIPKKKRRPDDEEGR